MNSSVFCNAEIETVSHTHTYKSDNHRMELNVRQIKLQSSVTDNLMVCGG